MREKNIHFVCAVASYKRDPSAKSQALLQRSLACILKHKSELKP